VRQLENICHWLTVMAPAQVIEAKDLPPELLATRGVPVRRGDRRRRPRRAPTGPAADAGGRAAAARDGRGSAAGRWLLDLERESRSLLQAGAPEVWDTLTRKFEAQLIHTALEITRGRRIEAAQKLGIGRNTITRKIQELGLDD
jgi:two-component system nitrogen regulation response regulator GlnG